MKEFYIKDGEKHQKELHQKHANGISIDKLPGEYQEYKEQIATLRSYGLGLEEKTAYEGLIEWLETHNGQMPRSFISRNGKQVKRGEMTETEKKEVNVNSRWRKAPERLALEACKRNIVRRTTRRISRVQRPNSYITKLWIRSRREKCL